MKKLICFLFLSLFYPGVYAQVQDWSWVRTCTGSNDENASHMAIDGSGNLLVTGKYVSSTATLSTVTFTNSGQTGTGEFFLAKYNSSGILQWARTASGLDNDEGISVTTDGSNNIYVSGIYESPTITFGATTLSNTSAFSEVFVVKYDASGTLVWARTFGGNLLDDVRSIKADNSGNTYMTGSFRSLAVQFGSFGVINSGNSDAYLTKLDPSGVPLWAKQMGGAQNENGLAVTHDGSGNIYVGGAFTSTNLVTYNLANAGGSDIFLAKYDASGNLVSTKVIGGSLNETMYYLITDGSGNLYLAGSYESATLNLGSSTLSNGSTRDMALIKMNSSLSVTWAKKVNGNLSSNPTSLFIESSNLYMSGSYNTTGLNFGTVTLTNPSVFFDGFIAKYDLSGNDLWAKTTNSAGDEEVKAVVVDNLGSLYVAGFFSPTLTLSSNTLTGAGLEEMFFAKICTVPSSPTVTASNTICPRQTATLSAQVGSGINAAWFSSATGGTALTTGNTFTANSNSTYFVEAINPTTGCINATRVSVSLSVQPGPSVSVSGKTLTATAGSSYKWIECDKDSVLPGANSQTYNIVKTGHYAVIVTNNGCVDTSACQFYSVTASGTIVVTTSIFKSEKDEFVISVFPNPSDGNLTIQCSRDLVVQLVNMLGQPVRQLRFDAANDHNQFIQGLDAGIYFLSAEGIKIPKRVVVAR